MAAHHVTLAVLLAATSLSWNAAQAQQPPAAAAAGTASPDELASAVESIASVLRDGYVFPDVGEAMAADVLNRLAEGEYEGLADERSLAARLTEDLRAISHDKHLGVVFSPRDPSSAASIRRPSAESMRRDNFSFRKVELLEGNIGYLRFDLFIADDEAKDTAAAAMAFLAHADGLIIDLRRNGGGSPDMIRFITSYFFDEPTLLNTMVDRNGEVVDEFHTLKSVPGRRFPADLPIFVLTSNYTFSGAEEFSYNLKHLDRAVIIGETTGGGAHPVRGERISDQLVLRVPFMRARNPITGTNWEGTGVKPHIEVSADEALDRAIQEAKGPKAAAMPASEIDWPTSTVGAAAAAFFEAFGDDEAMKRFSERYRTAQAREARSDAAYAQFWREYAAGATPESYVYQNGHEITVTAHLKHYVGRDGEAHFRFEFDPEPPHGLRAVHITTIR